MLVSSKLLRIPLEEIRVQQHIPNRNTDTVSQSHALLELAESIRKNGLIHPITVIEENEREYTLYVGERRYLAYRMLLKLEGDTFSKILAFVHPKNTSVREILNLTIHENDSRQSPRASESIESKIAMIPFFFSNSNSITSKEDNFKKGFKILSLFNSYRRSTTENFSEDAKAQKWVNRLKEETQHHSPITLLREYFGDIGEDIPSFYRKARVFFECEEDILKLYRSEKISTKNALKLQKIPKEDRARLLSSMEQGVGASKVLSEYGKYKKQDERDRDEKYFEILSLVEALSVLLKNKNKNESRKLLKKIEKLLKEI